MPRPDQTTRTEGRAHIAALKKRRDKIHADAEKAKTDADAEMWAAIAELIRTGQVLQADAAAETGFTRDHVLKQTKRYSSGG
ncbi:hypothetical protein ACFVXG_38355 [Kitasatospora sp. NPDC058162]|uniref:hypothetical protein n=1 Tax=unclassified Kitasatospora TaxID=2633591 RepID=UPI0036C5856F